MAKKKRRKAERPGHGELRREPMPPEFVAALEQQRERFRVKFGRDPLPHDPIFFDPTRDEPTAMSEAEGDEMQVAVTGAMLTAGIEPALVYAYVRTGYIRSTENEHLIPEEGKREWDAAIEEWDAMEPEERATALGSARSSRRQ